MAIFVLALKLLLVGALVRLLLLTGRPFVYAGVYAVFATLLNLLLVVPWTEILVRGGVCVALAMLYFWFIDRFLSSNIAGLVIMGGGGIILAIL